MTGQPLSPLLATLALVAYAAILLAAGWWGERGGGGRAARSLGPLRYSLSLATLCSAWTYFGSVGAASEGSWLFLANALGPMIALTAGYPVWRKLAILAKRENVGSLADFLAARYGKSAALGSLCAAVAAIGALPYIALQLDILGQAWSSFVSPQPLLGSSAIPPLALLVLIALVFGARRPSLSQQSTGFVNILSIEAVVKLVALTTAAAFAMALLAQGHGPAAPTRLMAPPAPRGVSFLTLTLLCTATFFTLPRQFHVGFVTLERVSDTRAARWIVPAYFAVWALATLVIGIAIRGEPALDGVPAPLRLLALPDRHGLPGLVLLVLLGGMSAGAAMVVVELTATSAMVANEIVLPMVGRIAQRSGAPSDVGRWILFGRRAAILVLGLAAWAYHRAIAGAATADQLGQIALSAFAQFLPALIGGLYWRRGHVSGAIAGIAAGSLLWLITIAIPSLVATVHGPARTWGHESGRTLEMAILLSLSVNILLYVVLSVLARPRLVDTIQARVFVGDVTGPSEPDRLAIKARMADIESLLARFIGHDEARKAILDLRTQTRSERQPEDQPITQTQARMAEKLLAGVIGAPAARNVVGLAISTDELAAGDVSRILDDAADAVHFSRDLLQNALQGLDQGISVVDRDHRLIAWNARYLQMLNLSGADLYVGKPLADLLLQRTDGEVVNAIRSNLLGLNGSIARGEWLEEEWHLEDGRILQVIGKPLPGGDYLSTLADISSLREAERVLAQDKETLERRVELRTRELTVANSALAEAKFAAENATSAQKRFVATASHDLVQPLHAARLFISTVKEAAGLAPAHADLLRRADESVDGAFRLMRALLNLSRLETSAAEPAFATVDLDPLFASLCEEFGDQAEARGLRFVVRPTSYLVRSDPDLLRSVIQNLVLNSIRYTPAGTIMVAARPAGDCIRLEVRDTGIGIDASHLEAVFGEFQRLPQAQGLAEGAGLGLSIVARISHFLNHPVAIRSSLNRGSIFSILVPRAEHSNAPSAQRAEESAPSLAGLDILCIDDEPEVLFGMKALLEHWGAVVTTASSGIGIPAHEGRWSAIIADQLLPDETGISILRRMAGQADQRILLTATAEDGWDAELLAEGIQLLRKPAQPLQLRAMLGKPAVHASIEGSDTAATS